MSTASSSATTSIVCPRCGFESHHPEDVRTGYCHRCHWWTSDPMLGAPDVIALVEAEGAIEPLEPDYYLVVEFGGRVVGRTRKR